MLLRSIRRMLGLCLEGQWGWKPYFPLAILFSLLAAAPTGCGYFLRDTKAVLNGCKDHWTLQDRTTIPLLFKMTVCVDIRVIVPGAWVAFSYSSVYAPRPELGLEGDDGAIYAWLLQVRHRFPLKLSPTHWHRVCLRRDVRGNTFSLEVDGNMVAERTVIAQAIPSSGSLWLGCRPRDKPPGANLGQVELYLFRMWADLGDHGPCEDGTVIGWNAQYWGVTSPSARQKDPNLLCATTLGVSRSLLPSSVSSNIPSTNVTTKTKLNPLNWATTTEETTNSLTTAALGVTTVANAGTTPSPVRLSPRVNTSPANEISASTQIPPITTLPANQSTPGRLFTLGSTNFVNCDASQLCYNKSAYYWMPIAVEGNKTEQDVHSLVSKAFGCHSGSDSGGAAQGGNSFSDFCQGDRQLQTVEVSCSAKINTSQTTCNVVLLLSHAVSPCELQRAGDSALQQAGGAMQAKIIGEVERVGQNLCKDVVPSSGGFVRCTSTSSLDDICQSNKSSTLTCSLLDSNTNPAPQPKTDSCSRETPHFCDCTAFCNSTSQFYAFRININSVDVNINSLKRLLLITAAHWCTAKSQFCDNIAKNYQRTHLECHGANQRLYSCIVIFEMYGPVNGCALKELVQRIIETQKSITITSSLTRLMVCGPPGLSVHTLLVSNLTWVASNVLISDVCRPDPTHFTCETNQTLAVLLTDSCPSETSTTSPTTTQPSTLTNSITTATKFLQPFVTNSLGEIYATSENTAQKTEKMTGSQTPTSTQSSTTQPVLQTSSLNISVTVSNNITVLNTSFNKTQQPNIITSANNMTVQNTTIPMTSLVQDRTTLFPNKTTMYNIKTADAITLSPNQAVYNETTLNALTHNDTKKYNVSAVTPSTDKTTKYNVTTVTPSPTSSATSPDFTTVYNQTINKIFTPDSKSVTVNNVTTPKAYTQNTTKSNVIGVTPSPNGTAVYNVTTVNAYIQDATKDNMTGVLPSPSGTTVDNLTTAEASTLTANHTIVKNVTASGKNHAAATHNNVYNVNTENNRALHNSSVTSAGINYTTVHNLTTATSNYSASTTSISYNTTTATKNDTTLTTLNYTTVYNSTISSSNYSATTNSNSYNATPASNNYTTIHDTAKPAKNFTTSYNTTTKTNNYTTSSQFLTTLNNTTGYNSTTSGSNYSAIAAGNSYNTTTATINYTVPDIAAKVSNSYSAATASNNNITEYNTSTAAINYTAAYNSSTSDNNKNATTANNNSGYMTTAAKSDSTLYSAITAGNNHSAMYNATTASNNYNETKARSNYTTANNEAKAGSNYTTVYNTPTTSTNFTTWYNATTASFISITATTDNNYTSMQHATTPNKNYTTAYNASSDGNNSSASKRNYTIVYNTTAPGSNYTAVYNATTASNNYTSTYSASTVANNFSATTTQNYYTTAYNTNTPGTNFTTVYNATTLGSNFTTVYNATTPGTNFTTVYNATTPGSNFTTVYNATTPGTNYTAVYNATTPGSNFTTVYNTTTPGTNYTKVYNATTIGSNYTTVYNATTPASNFTTVYNATTPKSIYTTVPNATTPGTNFTTVYNATTPGTNYTAVYNATTPGSNYTTVYNATTPASIYKTVHNATTPGTSYTTVYNATTPGTNYTKVYNATTPASNFTTVYNAATPGSNFTTVYNATTPASIYTTVHNATTPGTNFTTVHNATTPASNFTTVHNATTPGSNFTTVYNATTPGSNFTTVHNATTPGTSYTAVHNATTPGSNYTAVYNATTPGSNFTTVHNAGTPGTSYTTVYNATTPGSNFTTVYNATTPGSNFTTVYNATTPGTNYTAVYNATAPSSNFTTVYNATTPESIYTTVYNATTPGTSYTTVHNATTPASIYTTVYNATTPGTNYTTVYNAATPASNYTTVYNATTPGSNYTAVYNATTPGSNFTTVYNATTPASNFTKVHNTTTDGTSSTTVYNATTPGSHYTTVHNATTPGTSYTTVYNATTPPSNFTTVHNTTTTSNNYTREYNATTPGSKSYTTVVNNQTLAYNVTTASTTLHNGTATNDNTTVNPITVAPNHTMVNNITAASNNYTTVMITATNKSTTVNTTRTQNTTAAYQNTTVYTSLVNNTAKPTSAPLHNQTENFTTVNGTHITTVSKNETSSPTTPSSIQTTEKLGVNLTTTTTSTTTTATTSTTTNASLVSATTATTATTTTTTVHGSENLNSTSAKASSTSETPRQTTTLTKRTTTTRVADTATTSMVVVQTTESAQIQEADELLAQTQDTSQLDATQVAQLVGKLERLLDRPSVSQSLGATGIRVVSNLMDANPEALSASANRLIRLVDDLGVNLAVTGDRGILSATSLVLAVRTVDGTNFPTTSVDILNTDNVQLRGLSRTRFKRSEPPLGSVFLPSSLTDGLSPEEQQQANRVQFTFYTKNAFFKDASLGNQTLVSPILGSSVANLSIRNLRENIEFTIRNINPVHENYTASCAFWDFTLNGGGGGWSSAGCFVVNATSEDTTCSCNHLTSFAILLDLSRQGLVDRQQARILTFITYIGCGISSLFLAVTLLTYLSFPKLLRDIPAKILVQLCFSLLFLNLVFLLDGWLALYPAIGLCISTAFFLHYFLLTSFTWAGLEALHMYLSIVRVFAPYLSRYMLKFTLMGWGIPLIIVIIVISVDKDNYGLVTYGKYTDGTKDDFCWLRNNIAFYVGVVAYFLLMFVLCLLVFIVVMVQLSRIKKQNPHNQSPNRSTMTDLRSVTGLVILLGLTWGFALFAWGPLYLPFVYLFSIFNSLQGFFVFVFHCAVKESVRRQWRTYLCCGKLRLPENSDWSRTATQNNRNQSVATATTSGPQFTSRSSSVISEGTNSSGSVFVDSGISDGSNSDVALNEIHRWNLSRQGETN